MSLTQDEKAARFRALHNGGSVFTHPKSLGHRFGPAFSKGLGLTHWLLLALPPLVSWVGETAPYREMRLLHTHAQS